jgi:hypothetical protein
MSEDTRHIPLISSGVAGPLGILHLPRLWQKASLGAAGKLHGNYHACGKGFDQMVLDGLKIGREDFMAFIGSEKPSYQAMERWILEQSGGRVDPLVVAGLNRSIAAHTHDPTTRAEILSDCGVDSEGAALDAVTLNNLDDWQAFHGAIHGG